MSLCLRVKRQKLTVFVTAEPSDTILELKHKLQPMMEQAPERQRLYKDDTLLEDSKTLSDLKVDNDDILAVAFQLPGSGDWEATEITPLDDAKEGGRAYYE